MGKVEIDDRGRLTLPSKIREKLLIKSGDKLSIKVNGDKKTADKVRRQIID